MTTILAIAAALILDWLLGEPRRFHPLVGFGHAAQWLESRIHGDSRARGALGVFGLLAPLVLLAWAAGCAFWSIAVDVLVLYIAIGWSSLRRHARDVGGVLREAKLDEARAKVGLMVSRDTAALDEAGISRASLESVLENGNDAILGALLWYVVAGAPGVVLYRLANTLDAMWGYRNRRYRRFGWAAARLDDVLNAVPARLTALGYAINGRTRAALRCWREQGGRWKSRNAGVVMAAGAGALGVLLGGPASYDGSVDERPVLGEGRSPEPGDIERALTLVRGALFFWLLVLALVLVSGGWIVERFTTG